MQNKLPIIAVVIAILAIVGVVAYTQIGKPPKSSQGTEVSEQAGESGVGMAKGTLASLLGAGKNTMCKMSYSDENGSTEGTAYVSGQKMRGDFTYTADGKAMTSHMIRDDQYSYIWSDEESKGTKIKTELTEQAQEETASPAPQGGVDVDKEVDLDCSGWGVDNSKFTPPSNIEFMDLSATMMQVQEQSQDTKQQQKAACDQITDPQAKAACLQYAQ